MTDEFKEQLNPAMMSDGDIFTKIWTSPREVFTFINTYKYDKHTTLLLILAGITSAFDRATTKDMGDNFSLWGVIGFCVIMGTIFGWISYYIFAALISWTGKWIDGQGNTDSILRVLSYALIPSAVSLLMLIPQIAIYGNEIFKSEGDTSNGDIMSNILYYGTMIIDLTLGIWSLVLCVIGISEVQKLSIGKSILNFLLPAIVFLTPIFVIILIIFALK